MQNHFRLFNGKFIINGDVMEYLNIPNVDIVDGHDEIWSFVVTDRHKSIEKSKRYIVSNYGRVYDLKKHRLLSFIYGPKSSNGYYYKSVHFETVEGETNPTYFVHRLVALAFIPRVDGKPFVNHINACPSCCWAWNLEWCNASENYRHAVKHGLINQSKGESRPNSLWTDEEIHMICSMMQEGHKATYIYNVLGDILKDEKVTYERVRTLVKHIKHRTHWTHISDKYNISQDKFDYSKEKSSTKKVNERREKLNEYTKNLDPEAYKLP